MDLSMAATECIDEVARHMRGVRGGRVSRAVVIERAVTALAEAINEADSTLFGGVGEEIREADQKGRPPCQVRPGGVPTSDRRP